MLRRTAVGRAVLLFFFTEFNEDGVFADLHHRFQRKENLLFGKFEPLTAGCRKTDDAAFGKGKTDIADLAEILSVKKIDHVLLF